VSCGSPSFCVAVDKNGRALSFNGATWSNPAPVDGVNELTSVSCRPSGFCMAADNQGRVLMLTHGVWSRPVTIGGLGSPLSISCASSRFCIAAGVSLGSAEAWTFRDGSWMRPTLLPIPIQGSPSVACASVSFCVAVSGTEATRFNGTRWSQPASIAQAGYLDSVSCPSQTFCTAVNGNGGAITFDGRSWGTLTGIEYPYAGSSVSCPQPGFCVSVTSDQTVTLNGNVWSQPSTIDTPNELTSVSCPSLTTCVALDTDGRALTAVISGVPKYVTPFVHVNAASAPVNGCLAKIQIACKGGISTTICRGTLSLTLSTIRHVTRRIRGHLRAVEISGTTLLARVSYQLPAGKQRLVVLRLSRHAYQLLLRGRKHHLRVRATATLDGGRSAHRTVTLHLNT
jgi:hypothetical protein